MLYYFSKRCCLFKGHVWHQLRQGSCNDILSWRACRYEVIVYFKINPIKNSFVR